MNHYFYTPEPEIEEIDYQELKDVNKEIKKLERKDFDCDFLEYKLESLISYREDLYYLEEENFDLSYAAYENIVKDNEEYIKSLINK